MNLADAVVLVFNCGGPGIAHREAAKAHSALSFHPDLSQPGKARHIALGAQHTNKAVFLESTGK